MRTLNKYENLKKCMHLTGLDYKDLAKLLEMKEGTLKVYFSNKNLPDYHIQKLFIFFIEKGVFDTETFYLKHYISLKSFVDQLRKACFLSESKMAKELGYSINHFSKLVKTEKLSPSYKDKLFEIAANNNIQVIGHDPFSL